MTPNKESIKRFFEGEKQYTIPVYQRAYSWEETQWSIFLEDLQEATKGDNNYFFGNILLEKLTNSETNDIIDGQQRITTIIIFARAICNILKIRAEKEKLNSKIENNEFIKYIEEDYLINRSKPKLEVVEYDKEYFKDFIINNYNKKHAPQTPSQNRIKEAKEFFEKSLNKLETKDILAIFEAMQKSEILSIPFASKKDSVLMFELQNNRGKNLTNMEKLKSYIAYQVYTYCDKENSELKLNDITKIFEEIYRLINDIKISEDDLLNYFNISKFGFQYRENDNTLNYKKELKNEPVDKKINWIEKYIRELKNAFVDFKKFEEYKSIYKDYLQYLDVWAMYPFILKAYSLFRDDENSLNQVFKLLEIIAFRHRLIRTSANLASRLNEVLRNFNNIENLFNGLKDICDNKWYWRDEVIVNSLSHIYDENPTILPYLLMRYENYLRNKKTQTKGYKFELKGIQNIQIEHISPLTKDVAKLNSGYCEYDDEFYDKYLNCIGNLLLIDGSHNGSIGNKPFAEKLKSYEKSPLLQHQEVKSFVVNENSWDKEAIDKRHEKLKKFVLETWSF